MSFQLKIDEMLDALCEMGHPQASELTRLVESTADVLSAALCWKLDITCERASFQGLGFAGTCVPFRPKHHGQELPAEIASYDDKEEWGA
jgi:hypothetical protein